MPAGNTCCGFDNAAADMAGRLRQPMRILFERTTTTCNLPYIIPTQPRTVAIKFGQKFQHLVRCAGGAGIVPPAGCPAVLIFNRAATVARLTRYPKPMKILCRIVLLAGPMLSGVAYAQQREAVLKQIDLPHPLCDHQSGVRHHCGTRPSLAAGRAIFCRLDRSHGGNHGGIPGLERRGRETQRAG